MEIRDQSTGDIILPDDSKLLEYVNKEKSYVKQLDQDEVMDYSQQIHQLNFDKYYMLNILNFDSGDTRLSSFSRILNTATRTTTTTTTGGRR